MSSFTTRNLEVAHLVNAVLTVSGNAGLKQAAHRNIHGILKSSYNDAYCFIILFLYCVPWVRHGTQL